MFKLVEELLRQVVVGFDASALDLGRRRRRNGAALRLRAGGGSARRAGRAPRGPACGAPDALPGASRGARRFHHARRCASDATREPHAVAAAPLQSTNEIYEPVAAGRQRDPATAARDLAGHRHLARAAKDVDMYRGSAAGLWARPTVTIREWLRTVATIPPRCFFFTSLLTSPGGTRPQPSQRLGLYASLGPNAPFFFVFSSPKNKKNTLDAH